MVRVLKACMFKWLCVQVAVCSSGYVSPQRSSFRSKARRTHAGSGFGCLRYRHQISDRDLIF